MAAKGIRGDKLSGQVIDDRYELIELIDSGGQGHVYRARDMKEGDLVAVKVLKQEYTEDVEWRERMFREARALSLLTGTSAVKVYDQKWTADGALCIVMELLTGVHLDDYLAALQRLGRQLSPQDLEPLIAPIVQTLEVAHRNNILHRDIKPANIYVLEGGAVRLLDFGFAKFTHLRPMTRYGQIAGSPSYLAPEAWAGNSKLLDRRVDVYGLAAVIFRALANRPPFVGDPITLLRLATTGERPSLHALRPDLPAKVDDWVQAALAASPDERFDGVTGMWNAFKIASGLKPAWQRG
ncbi:MAG TPA: serine/threonine-protein kinase [Polyangiaceae bacterium]|nr:serine/threonine-protein kinase [Polyangiaceae bacterium]